MMRTFILLFGCCLALLAFGQDKQVKGHYTKKGKWVPAHTVKHESHEGQHRERVWVKEHMSGGHAVKGHWATVWVDD